jgi:hypothetical protein
MMCHARYPETPKRPCSGCSIFYPQREVNDYRLKSRLTDFLQIRDDTISHEYPRKENCAASSLLPAERAALSQTGLATGGLAQDGGASLADDDGLGVREDGGDGEAAGALDVHEEGAGTGHKGLELVLAGLVLRARVEKVDGENHIGGFLISID